MLNKCIKTFHVKLITSLSGNRRSGNLRLGHTNKKQFNTLYHSYDTLSLFPII